MPAETLADDPAVRPPRILVADDSAGVADLVAPVHELAAVIAEEVGA